MQAGYSALLHSFSWAGEPSWSWLGCHSKPLLHTRQWADGQPCRTHTAHKHNGLSTTQTNPTATLSLISAFGPLNLWPVGVWDVRVWPIMEATAEDWLDIDVSCAHCSTCESESSWRRSRLLSWVAAGPQHVRLLRRKACIIKEEHHC